MLNWLQLVGCLTVYVAFVGDFYLSLWGAIISVPTGLAIAILHVKGLGLRGVLGGVGKLWLKGALLLYCWFLYFSLVGYGVLYPLHSVLGREESLSATIIVKHLTAAPSRPSCNWFLKLKYLDGKKGTYCVPKEVYGAYSKAAESAGLGRDVYASVVIKRSILGNSLMEVTF